MNNGKAIFCTAAMTVMTVLILVGLFLLRYFLAFVVIAAIFACVGLAVTSGGLYVWLTRRPAAYSPLPPVDLPRRDQLERPSASESSLDDIVREVKEAVADE